MFGGVAQEAGSFLAGIVIVDGSGKSGDQKHAQAEQRHQAADCKLLTTSECHLPQIIRDQPSQNGPKKRLLKH